MRVKAIISYDGSNYKGMQKQKPGIKTIIGTIEKNISRTFSEEITVRGASRTDAGVHANGQVIDFEISHDIEKEKLRGAINNCLPPDIYFKEIEFVDDSFHARYNTIGKEYHYYLTDKEYDPHIATKVLHVKNKMNLKLIKEAANVFVGTHDFLSFSSDERTETIRTINSINIEEANDKVIIKVEGDGFLMYQIRHMVGTMLAYSDGKIELSYITDLLNNPSKGANRHKVPGIGLYLDKVFY